MSIYLLGSLVTLMGMTLYAGLTWRSFLKDADYYAIHLKGVPEGSKIIDEDRVGKFIVVGVLVLIFWPIALPAVGAFLLGRKFSK